MAKTHFLLLSEAHPACVATVINYYTRQIENIPVEISDGDSTSITSSIDYITTIENEIIKKPNSPNVYLKRALYFQENRKRPQRRNCVNILKFLCQRF